MLADDHRNGDAGGTTLHHAAGVTTTLRLAPVPPNVILASGTSVVFEEVAERVKLPGRVSASPMVNVIVRIGVFSFVDCGAIAVMRWCKHYAVNRQSIQSEAINASIAHRNRDGGGTNLASQLV